MSRPQGTVVGFAMNGSERSLNLLEMILEGKTRAEIAEILGVTPFTVYKLQQHPEFIKLRDDVLQGLTQDLKTRFSVRAAEAADKVYDLALHARAERVALAASQDILDRAGYKPKTEVENLHVVRFERSRLDLIAATARELGPGYIEGVAKVLEPEEPVLSNQSSPGQEQTSLPFAPGDVRLHPAPRTEDPRASTTWPLQDDDRERGIPDMAASQ